MILVRFTNSLILTAETIKEMNIEYTLTNQPGSASVYEYILRQTKTACGCKKGHCQVK